MGRERGIFSCVGRQCAVTDSNTQRTSALVLTHKKHTVGDAAGVLWVSPYTGKEEKMYLACWSLPPTHLSLYHTHTHKPTHKPAFAWSRISHIVILRPSLHYRGHDHTRLHVCAWPKAKNREMNRDVYMKEFYVTYPRGSICTVHLREKRHSEKKQIEVARVSQWLFVGKEAACNSQQPEVIIFKYVLRI